MDGCLARTITKIEANPLLVRGKSDFRIMRVAAYCRVSTDDEDQLNSYQAQIAYYTDAIAKRPNSTFAGIYADEGITGTSTKKRKDFLRLMRDCERGKVDYILTKSISRFARNTVDSLSWVAKIRSFETEQAQAHKTTIFSGVSMTVPSPTTHPHPRCFASAPSPSPEGVSTFIHHFTFCTILVLRVRLEQKLSPYN